MSDDTTTSTPDPAPANEPGPDTLTGDHANDTAAAPAADAAPQVDPAPVEQSAPPPGGTASIEEPFSTEDAIRILAVAVFAPNGGGPEHVERAKALCAQLGIEA